MAAEPQFTDSGEDLARPGRRPERTSVDRWLAGLVADSLGIAQLERSAAVSRLAAFAVICSATWLGFGVAYAAMGRYRTASLALVVGASALLTRQWMLGRDDERSVTHAAHLMTGTSTVGLMVASFWSGQGESLAAWFLLAVPLFVSYQFQVRDAVGWSLAVAVGLLLIHVSPRWYSPTPEFIAADAEILVGQLAILLLFLTSGLTYSRTSRSRIDRLTRQADEMRRVVEHASRQELLFETITQASPNAIYIIDFDTRRAIYANKDAQSSLGYGPEEIRSMGGAFLERIAHPDDRPVIEQHFDELRRAEDGEYVEFVHRVRTRGGEYRWMHNKEVVFRRHEDGSPSQVLGVAEDVTDRKQGERDLIAANERLRRVVDTLPQGVIVTDRTGGVVVINEGLRQLLGFRGRSEDLLGIHLGRALERAAGSLLEDKTRVMATVEQLLERGRRHSTGELALTDGRVVQIECVPLGQAVAPSGWLWSLRDITESKRTERALVARIQHDHLTGIASREHFREQLEIACRRGEPFALLFVDLDGFKAVNDTYGHGAGDEVLKAVASRLAARTRLGDLVARIGGDEFTLILNGVEMEPEPSRILHDIVRSVAEPCSVEGKLLHVTATVGVAFYPTTGKDADTLLRVADDAMYAAKQAGKNAYALAPRRETHDTPPPA